MTKALLCKTGVMVLVVLTTWVMAPFSSWAAGLAATNKVTIRTKGSDTMHALSRLWAENYQKEYPAVTITTDGSGSGSGIAALINGHVDIALSSRAMRPQEIRMIRKRSRQPQKEYVVGWDALSFVVHRDNPLMGLPIEKLIQLYTRGNELKNWRDLGVTVPGCDTDPIVLGSRKNNSGTYHFFLDVLSRASQKRQHLVQQLVNQEHSSNMISWIAQSPCALGYSGMAHVTADVKTLCLETGPATCLYPTAENIRNRGYPLIRPLYLYLLDDSSAAIQHYVDWIRGPAGQAIVQQVGFMTITE
ncbi:MAG: phosphate ABC transporter substrate-binding protein [Magnetococcales bacterium]|nr:phosphate ABC transporter substrate-binding protein [Magnetococcales bacterium]